MFQNFATIIQNQYEAAFSTVNRCLAECEDDQWDQLISRLTFSQAAFHALFYADVYLHRTFDDGTLENQEFHRQHTDVFRDYEELQDRPQQYHYERSFVLSYLAHCRTKMVAEFSEVTEAWLLERLRFRGLSPHDQRFTSITSGTFNIMLRR